MERGRREILRPEDRRAAVLKEGKIIYSLTMEIK
jgi:hypothetical protein